MQEKKSISVILITWNDRKIIQKCLDSFYHDFSFNTDEIVVIDNGSSDGTDTLIKQHFPLVRYFWLKENLGVAGARNRAVIASRGDYVMTLDNDTRIITNFAAIKHAVVTSFGQVENLGVLGFKLCYPDGSYQFNGRTFPGFLQPFASRIPLLRRWSFFRELLKRHTRNDLYGKSDGLHEVDYLLGANQIFRRDSVVMVGLYDASIFFGPEDLELCWRFKRDSYRNMINLSVEIIHDYQRRTTKINTLMFKHLFAFYKTWYKIRKS